MLKRAQILHAGRMLAAALAAATAAALLAQPATSQTTPAQTIDVTNDQAQNGNVSSDQTVNIVENYGLLNVTTDTAGNIYAGGNDQVDATITSHQTNFGTMDASITVTGTNTGAPELSLGTPVYVQATATTNSLSWNGKTSNTNLVDVNQTDQGAHVYADAQINSPNNSLYEGVEVNSVAVSNHMAAEISNGRLDMHASQGSTTDVRARTGAVVVYSPSPNLYTATAINNDMTTYSADRGTQEVTISQQAQGQTESYVSLNGGNMWDAAVTSSATANNIIMENTGGSLVATTSQGYSDAVMAQAVQTQYEYGTATNQAYGVGNSASFTNNDIYMRLDIDQVADGGVSAVADTTLNDGYDAYIDSAAVGNQIVGSACASCGADVGITSNQVNNAAISSVANTTVTGSNRSVVSSSRAVGNSATYYVTGKQ